MPDLQEVCILIPCHSFDDFPSDLSEAEAEGLLNSFAVAWHPALVAASCRMPQWSSSDEPPSYPENKLFLAAPVCDGWMPHDWPQHACEKGAKVIHGVQSRAEYQRRIEELVPGAADVPDMLVRDFYALGLCYLMIELLTRKMHYFTSINETNLERDAVAAAEAALSGDEAAMKSHLHACFEVLLEAREHFYPVDCYLLDLCLLNPETADEHLKSLLERKTPVNFLLKAEDLDAIARARPEGFSALKASVTDGTCGMVGGDRQEKPLPLVPIHSALFDLAEGHAEFQKQFGSRPRIWGRRRYGFSTQLPQILTSFGYRAALHIALDDGLYPDEEQSKLRWEGCDGTVIDAVTRIPLAGDSAAAFLRFPDRMAESMQDDQVAGLLFARWPDLKTEWLDDLRRIQSYLPVLGRFATFEDFVRESDHSGRLAVHDDQDYLSPFLLQHVAYGEADPVSRYLRFFQRRHVFDCAAWASAIVPALRGEPLDSGRAAEWEARIERSGPDLPEIADNSLDADFADWCDGSFRSLAQLITGGGKESRGLLAVNALSFPRSCVLDLHGFQHPPAVEDPVRAVQWDESCKQAVVELPGSGFVWIREPDAPQKLPTAPVPSAEELLLRNEFFELLINEHTGGIQYLKNYGRHPNRLSQQTTFRFPRERTFTRPHHPAQEIKTFYAEMELRKAEITRNGPARGEIVTESDLVDQTNGNVIATCKQTVSVWRHLPLADLTIELEPRHEPDGDPWSSYYASRFAWHSESAAVTGGLMQGAIRIYKERIESPYYLEFAEDEQRTTLLFGGIPFHRRTGPNMLDTILIPAGEMARRFQIRIGFDVPYPMQAAHDFLAPPLTGMTARAPQTPEGWFFHLKQSNVQILGLSPLLGPEDAETETTVLATGFCVRLLETEGRNRKVKLRMFRAPTRARIRDHLGKTVKDLAVSGDAVFLEMRKHQFADVEIFYDPPGGGGPASQSREVTKSEG